MRTGDGFLSLSVRTGNRPLSFMHHAAREVVYVAGVGVCARIRRMGDAAVRAVVIAYALTVSILREREPKVGDGLCFYLSRQGTVPCLLYVSKTSFEYLIACRSLPISVTCILLIH